MKPTYADLYAEISSYAARHPKISTHCHQLPERELAGFGLDALLTNSYINWCGVPWGDTLQSRHEFFQRLSGNSFLVWMQKSLAQLYPGAEPLSASSWSAWDQILQTTYQEPHHSRQVLADKCGYARMLLDAYWDPGSDNGAGDFFSPVYRVNSFFFGYSDAATDHDGNNPYMLSPHSPIEDLDEYVDWMRMCIQEHRARGCVALKLPIAYDRGLDFHRVGVDEARAAFGRLVKAAGGQQRKHNTPLAERARPSNAPDPTILDSGAAGDSQDIRLFQDYLLFRLSEMAAEFDLPLQIHTGMGQGRATNAAQLQEAIVHHPATRFVLLHCSYPWTQDMSLLMRLYPNVFADLSWLPLGSSQAAIQMLHELLEGSSLERIFWGCDTWTPEESFGASLAGCHCLGSALAEKVIEGHFTRSDALRVVDAILFENPRQFYKLDVDQKA